MNVKVLGAACAVALLGVIAPGTALAQEDVAVYPPGVEERSFVTSIGGWEAGNESGGLCGEGITCPTVTIGHAPSGGTLGDADGYLRTDISSLTGVSSESRGIARSPRFTYRGVNGKRADDVVLTLGHRAQINPLLSVAGNSVDYSVELVDVSEGDRRITVIDSTPLENTDGWTYDLGDIDPRALQVGHEYRTRVITRFAYGVEIVPGGFVGYDDIGFVAIRKDGGGAGGPGKPGPGQAILDGRNLFLKLRCFGEQGKNGKCHTRATALKRKKGARVTFPIQRVVKAKKGKVIRARVRFKFVKELQKSRSIVLRSVLRTNRRDKTPVVKYKKLKLIKRD